MNILNRLLIILEQSNDHTFVVEHDNQVIAYTGFIRFHSWELDGELIKIQVFVVDEKYRGQGVGKQLLKAVEEFAKAYQISRALLDSSNRPEREIAHKFYKGLGFEPKSTGFNKWIDLN